MFTRQQIIQANQHLYKKPMRENLYDLWKFCRKYQLTRYTYPPTIGKADFTLAIIVASRYDQYFSQAEKLYTYFINNNVRR